VLLLTSASVLAQENSLDAQAARLARLHRPWLTAQHLLTIEQYEASVNYWARQYSELVTLEKRATSHDGLPVYLLKITDSTIPDEDKQVALVTALHGGPERTGQ
jgi:hypothetical protein